MRTREPIWITGVGTANPLADNYEESVEAFLAGRSGVRTASNLAAPDHPGWAAGQIETLSMPNGFDETEFATLNRAEQLFLWCAVQALRDAGLWERRSDIRVGLLLGFGAESMFKWSNDWQTERSIANPDREKPFTAATVRNLLNLSGPATTVGAACASGNLALALGRRWLDLGWADICLAGGGEMGVSALSLATFGNLGALSKRYDQPTKASRPFDRQRDGLVMGEGGAMFVLETSGQAKRRGARAYAELAGCASSSDAFHMVIPNSDPTPCASAMLAALADAGVNPDELDHVSAHATSTPVGDSAEARALRLVLGEAVARIPVSATKSMTGHALSGAAAIGAVACLAALDRQVLPPTINLEDPDPECNLCHVAPEARPHRVRTVLSNSFGFGGSNTAVVFRKVA